MWIALVISAIGIALFIFLFNILEDKYTVCFTLCAICIFLSGVSCGCDSQKEQKQTDSYYLEAEVLATDQMANTTVFTSDQGMYCIIGQYYDVSPYLLTMDTNGTKETNDDKIIVVWRCEN